MKPPNSSMTQGTPQDPPSLFLSAMASAAPAMVGLMIRTAPSMKITCSVTQDAVVYSIAVGLLVDCVESLNDIPLNGGNCESVPDSDTLPDIVV